MTRTLTKYFLDIDRVTTRNFSSLSQYLWASPRKLGSTYEIPTQDFDQMKAQWCPSKTKTLGQSQTFSSQYQTLSSVSSYVSTFSIRQPHLPIPESSSARRRTGAVGRVYRSEDVIIHRVEQRRKDSDVTEVHYRILAVVELNLDRVRQRLRTRDCSGKRTNKFMKYSI